jgi:DNA-binding protein H-NS
LLHFQAALLPATGDFQSRVPGVFQAARAFHCTECLMPPPNIKSLSVPELLALRDAIDRLLESRRAELQAQLEQIGGGKPGGTKGSKVPPKYRHPDSGETWSGRGGVAGWLARELATGSRLEDFLIDRPARKATARSNRRAGG